MLNFLPDDIFDEVSPFIGKGLDELRIRADKPVFALINGKFVRLGGVVPTKTHIEKAIIRLTGHSVYNYEQSIKLGYITGDEGERVGICGDCVVDGQVKFIKNVTSLCVRVPSDLTGCAKTVAASVFAEGIKNVLVISPPGAGKTTVLRDLARIASDELGLNVLVVDEKCELSGNGFYLGKRTDVMRGADKVFGLKCGVLNMRPDVIVLDELKDEREAKEVVNAVLSGVKVLASAHGTKFDDIKNRYIFKEILSLKVFDYAVVLSSARGAGTVDAVEKLC